MSQSVRNQHIIEGGKKINLAIVFISSWQPNKMDTLYKPNKNESDRIYATKFESILVVARQNIRE
jgi:hypothetical protein